MGWRRTAVRALCGAILVAVLAPVPAEPAQEKRASQPIDGSAASGSVEALLRHPDVQSELKLSTQQMEKVIEIARRIREKHQADFDKLRDPAVEQRRQPEANLTRTVAQETVEALRDVLDPGQVKRVEQIHLQQQGLRAFEDPKIGKALRLTDEQKNKLTIIAHEAAQEARKLFRPGAKSDFQQALKKFAEVRKAAIEKAIALLTDEQKKVWHGLIGEPFQVRTG